MTGCSARGAAPGTLRSDELTLDQLLAEPIVRQLMWRDGVNEATIRRLLREVAGARSATMAGDDYNTPQFGHDMRTRPDRALAHSHRVSLGRKGCEIARRQLSGKKVEQAADLRR